ncbi:MAG: DnaJ domain-containing protein [Anaerolineae bacterium]|nr:DnaJ domain-containing protein [Anaerolineae bacterium]
MDYKDYYGILGISRDADSDEVRRAYRKMARTYHPDVNPDKATATERFKDINEAYTVLSDSDKRRRYDQINTSYEQMRRTAYRSTSANRGSSARPSYTSSYSQSSSSSRTYSTGNRSSNTYSSASSSTAGGSARRAANGPSSTGGGSRRTNTGTISEEDMERIFRGFGWAYSAARGRRTSDADNTSGADFSDFFDALFGGLWGVTEDDPNSTEFRSGRDLQVDVTLTLEEAFSGAYRIVSLKDGRKVEISIPAGVSTGSKLRVRDQGERRFGRPRGHLYVNITVKPHPQLARDGDDLRVKVTVPYQTAARSGEVRITAPDRTVVLKIPAGTRTGQVFRLKGLGMPRLTPDKLRGDLLVEVMVQPAPRPPKSKPKSSGPRPAARRSASTGARVGAWLRKLLGVGLLAVGLTALVAVMLNSGIAGWQAATTIGAILVAHGLATRSWSFAPGAIAVGAGVGYAVWIGAEAMEVAQYTLPLLPLALGVYLLLYRSAG